MMGSASGCQTSRGDCTKRNAPLNCKSAVSAQTCQKCSWLVAGAARTGSVPSPLLPAKADMALKTGDSAFDPEAALAIQIYRTAQDALTAAKA
jgi:hypothetical protein